MTDFDEIIRRNLENDFGAAAPYSDYKPGETIRYRVRVPGVEVYTGTIIWVAAQSPSSVEGHGPLPMRYIVERDGWTGFPDIVYQKDILTQLDPEQGEPILVDCPYCRGMHYQGQVPFCPLNPNR